MKIRNEYKNLGVDQFYELNKNTYENPHSDIIEKHLEHLIKTEYLNKTNKILDLCCGTGQVSIPLKNRSFNFLEGCDPYTFEEYKKRTGLNAYNFNFFNLLSGSLGSKSYDTIICSFALHLAPLSILPDLLYQLSIVSDKLIIISPHKNPAINFHWQEIYNYKDSRVHTRVFKKNNC